MSRPSIIFVNRYYSPDMSATAQILSSLAEALAARGHSIKVITSRQLYGNSGAQLPTRETINGVEVHRVAGTRFGRGNLAGRFVDYLTFGHFAARAVKQIGKEGDWVIAKTDPPNLASALTGAARSRKLKLGIWCQDLFPEVAAPLASQAPKARFPLKPLMAQRDRTYQKADAVVAISEDMRDYLVQHGVARNRIKLIPNWCIPPTLQGVETSENSLRSAWGLKNKFVAGYSGNLGRAHDYRTFLDAILRLQDHPNICFLFVGSGAMQEQLRRELPEAAQGRVLFKPYQPIEQLAQSLSVPDVHLISLRSSQSRFVYPSKYYGVLAVGRPVLLVGDPACGMAREMEQQRIGKCVAEGDGAKLAEEILTLSNNREACTAAGSRARQLYDSHYRFENRLTDWEALLGISTVKTESLATAR